MRVAFRVPLLVTGFLSLGFGVAAGLARLGFGIDLPAPALPALHGPLLAGAFFGTVISLERAVALGTAWAYAAPLAAAAAGVAWILGAPDAAGGALLVAGGLVLLAASVSIWKRQPELHNACLGAGAACWALGGAVMAAGGETGATPAWIGFLVLTIAGERLELSRFMPPSPAARRAFAGICGGLFAGCCIALLEPAAGWMIVAASLLALALWLSAKDIARRTVRERGLTRYIAFALLLGYAWLGIGALVALGAHLTPGEAQFVSGRPAYDAALHAWFLGFVFSMVFGHAPMIAPALLRVALPYHAAFYAPLVLLHATLAARIAGDLLMLPPLRTAGAAGNTAALVLFIVTMLAVGIRGRAAARARTV